MTDSTLRAGDAQAGAQAVERGGAGDGVEVAGAAQDQRELAVEGQCWPARGHCDISAGKATIIVQ